ncbi:MAG: hypothetical protein IK954_03555 [Clostridia bacterium]|nr:hypothetical protein [Clostridia bacterium]
MTDYLKTYEKFKDVKEVKDYIDDVILLRQYYVSQRYDKMQEHIQKLMNKYFVETAVWNSVNHYQPTTAEQSYINAESFLQTQGAKIITKTVKNYAQRLSKDEASNVEALAK